MKIETAPPSKGEVWGGSCSILSGNDYITKFPYQGDGKNEINQITYNGQ